LRLRGSHEAGQAKLREQQQAEQATEDA